MRRREFLRQSCAALVAAGVAASAELPPNIVLFLIDDLGWIDLGCQGSTFYETPAIDRLAREGMRFTCAYSNCPVCSPSRAAILTGRYPARLNFTGHITATGRHRALTNGRILPPHNHLFLRTEEVTLAEALKPAGYRSASIGKWHLGGEKYYPERQGFDLNIGGYHAGNPPSYFSPYKDLKSPSNSEIPTLAPGPPGEYLTDRLTDEAIRFIEQNRDRPFFLYFPHYAVHTPLEAPADPTSRYKRKMEHDHSQKNATYAAMIERVDGSVRRITEALERSGLSRRTIVILTSDNGGEGRATNNAPLREGKGFLYEGGIRVPLMLKWPGRVRPGSECAAPVMGMDLYPTICEIAGKRSAPQFPVDGKSLITLIEERKRPWGRRDLFWYYPHYSPQASQPGAAVRSGDWKLIEHYDPPRLELYDLSKDPAEKTDLAGQQPKRKTKLKRKLEAWLDSLQTIRHRLNPDFSPVRTPGEKL